MGSSNTEREREREREESSLKNLAGKSLQRKKHIYSQVVDFADATGERERQLVRRSFGQRCMPAGTRFGEDGVRCVCACLFGRKPSSQLAVYWRGLADV